MTKLGVCALILLTGSVPAYAQLPSSSPSKSHDPNRVICAIEQTTGTRLGARKVCKTAAEWAQMKAEHRESLEKFQQQATSTGTPSG